MKRLLLASAAALAISAGAAWADPVTLAAIGTGLAAVNWTAVAVSIGVSLATSALAAALAPKPKTERLGLRTNATTAGGTQPQSFIFGRYATAGNGIAPMMSHGESGTKGPGRQRFLTYVLDLGDRPITGFRYSIIDGNRVDFKSIEDTTSDFLGRGVDGGPYNGRAWAWFNDGAQTVADSRLLTTYGSYPERPWASDMVLSGIPYITYNFRFEPKVYQGLPQTKTIVDGMALLDRRDGTTAFSRNPVVQIEALMRGVDMGDGNTYGLGVPNEDMPASVWAAAANVCDENVRGDPRYRTGIEVGVDEEPFDAIQELAKGCGALLADMGGIWTIRVGPPTLPIFTFTDDDLIAEDPTEFEPFQSVDTLYNAVHATFPDPDQAWEPSEAVPVYDNEAKADDGGERRTAELSFAAVTDKPQVRRLMREMLADSRRQRMHVVTLPPKAAGLALLDDIAWTSETNGYTAKLFEIVGKTVDPFTLKTTLRLRERDPADYNEDEFSDNKLPANPSRALTAPDIDGLDGWTVEAITVPNDIGTLKPAIRMSWNAESDVGAVDWVIEKPGSGGGGTEIASGEAGNDKAAGFNVSAGIESLTTYRVRGRARSVTEETLWTSWVTVTTPDGRIDWGDFKTDLRDEIQGGVDAAMNAAVDATEAKEAAQNAQADVAPVLQELLEIAQLGPNGASATIDDAAGVLVTLDGKVRAVRGMSAQTSGGKVAAIYLTSYDDPDGSGGSAVEFIGDNILADGTVSARKVVVTDAFDLVLNGGFVWGDLRGWSIVSGQDKWSVDERDTGSSEGPVADAPTHYFLRCDEGNGVEIEQGRDVECAPGDEFEISFKAAGKQASTAQIKFRMRFFGSGGAETGVEELTFSLTGNDWTDYAGVITAPAGARTARIVLRRGTPDDGAAFFTKLSCTKRADAATLIRPDSIDTPLLRANAVKALNVDVENLAALNIDVRTADIRDLAVQSGKIDDLAVTRIKIGGQEVVFGEYIDFGSFFVPDADAWWDDLEYLITPSPYDRIVHLFWEFEHTGTPQMNGSDQWRLNYQHTATDAPVEFERIIKSRTNRVYGEDIDGFDVSADVARVTSGHSGRYEVPGTTFPQFIKGDYMLFVAKNGAPRIRIFGKDPSSDNTSGGDTTQMASMRYGLVSYYLVPE